MQAILCIALGHRWSQFKPETTSKCAAGLPLHFRWSFGKLVQTWNKYEHVVYISLGNDEVPFVLENFQRISEGDDFSQIVLLPSFPPFIIRLLMIAVRHCKRFECRGDAKAAELCGKHFKTVACLHSPPWFSTVLHDATVTVFSLTVFS